MTEKRPTVSVIIPTYNRVHLIGRAIQSVLDQSYQDFEIIIVDDASIDQTEEIVRNFADERINYIRHQKNEGGSAARNTGIKAAKGEFVAFLDSDDEWVPKKLEKEIDRLQTLSNEVGVVYSGFCCVKQFQLISKISLGCGPGVDVGFLAGENEVHGLEVGLVNCIFTYPAWDINGYLVSDWTMPLQPEAYYSPDAVGEYLNEAKYLETLNKMKEYYGFLEGKMRDDPDKIYEHALRVFKKTKEITIYLMNRYDWDFHATMFRFLDTIQHIYIHDEEKLLKGYKLADETLAEISEEVEDIDDETCWLINSDHSMCLQFQDGAIKGSHDTSGFYVFYAKKIFHKNQTMTLNIEDLISTVLSLFNIDVKGVRGRVREEMFKSYQAEEITVKDRLKSLGYI